VTVTQGFAYLTQSEQRRFDYGFNGIHVVDVRDPTNPTLLGLIANTGSGSRQLLSIEDGLAYLVNTLSGGGLSTLKVIDISNPFNAVMNPAPIGSMGSGFSDVAAVDKTVYVVGHITGAAMRGLHVIDAQDPANLILLGSLEQPYSYVAVAHGMAFVTSGGDPGLYAVDVNNPTSPTIIKSFDMPEPTDVIVTSNVAYVTTASSTRFDEAGNDVEFPASLYLLDARNPATVEILGSLSFGSGASRASGVAVADGLAYVVVSVATIRGEGVNWWRGLQVVDTRNPAQPVVIGSIPLFSSLDYSFYDSAVATADDVVYVANSVSVELVDVHNPSSPFLLKSIPFDSLEIPGNASNIVVADGFAYIGGSAGVQVMDIRDPLNPAHVFSLSTSSFAKVTVSDGYVYVAGSGLQIFQAAIRQVP
jgi:hypothetical protein